MKLLSFDPFSEFEGVQQKNITLIPEEYLNNPISSFFLGGSLKNRLFRGGASCYVFEDGRRNHFKNPACPVPQNGV